MTAILMHGLTLSLPNILSIILANTLFAASYPKREHASRGIYLYMVCAVVLSLISAAVRNQVFDPNSTSYTQLVAEHLFTIALFLTLLCISPLCIRMIWQLSWRDALFCTATGYVLQNSAHILAEVLIASAPFAPSGSNVINTVALIVSVALLFPIAYVTIISHMRQHRLEGAGSASSLASFIGAIAINIIFDVLIRFAFEAHDLNLRAYILVRLLQLMASVMTLYLGYQNLFANRLRAQSAAQEQLLQDQARQFKRSQETIDALNIKAHDLKHQIRDLAGKNTADPAFIASIKDLVDKYDTNIETNNFALSVLLSEKNLLCQTKYIDMTCSVDGSALSHMEAQDIYALFGNALDNAIEAVDLIENPEFRLIELSSKRQGNLFVITIKNYYVHELKQEEGRLVSSKGNALHHGFGLKSIEQITTKYHGKMQIDTQGGMFRLMLLFVLE